MNLIGAVWLHVCIATTRFVWSKGDFPYSEVFHPCLLSTAQYHFNVFLIKNFFIIRLLDTSRHSMEDVFKTITITLETLLEDEENQIRCVANYNNVLNCPPSFPDRRYSYSGVSLA